MSAVLGLSLSPQAARVIAAVEGSIEARATVVPTVGLMGDQVVVGVPARSCPPSMRVDDVTRYLAQAASDGVAGVAWPTLGGRACPPVELLARVFRAGLAAVERQVGRPVGAVVAVPVDLGGIERRVVRDAILAAGAPVARLIAAPAAVALTLTEGHALRALVIEVDDRAVRAAVVELADGVVDILGHATEPGLASDWPPAEVVASAQRTCDRALAAAAVTIDALSDAVVVGDGVHHGAVADHIAAWLGPVARTVAAPAELIALGAAQLATMFVGEPAAVTVDVVAPGWSLGAGSSLTQMIAAGAIAPTREVRLIARDRVDRTAIDLELWEDTVPPRPYGRYHITGLAPGAGAIAACEVTIDVDRIPRIEASDMVNGGALTVAPVVEVGLDDDALAALRAEVTAWEP